MRKLFEKKRNIILIIFTLFAVSLGIVSFVRFDGLKDGIIANGVSVAGVDVGGMSEEEARKVIHSYNNFDGDTVLMLSCRGKSFNIDAMQIKLSVDEEKSVDKAYHIGRKENAEENKKDIKKAKSDGINLAPVINFDEDKFLLTAGENIGSEIRDPSPMTVEVGEDCLVVTNSISGIVIDMDKTRKAIENELTDFKSDGIIEILLKEHKPDNLTFEEFRKEYIREPKDAVYTKEGDNHHIEPEILGISFDEEEARKIFEENANSTEPYKIPAVISYPEITASYLEDKYVNKIIAKYSTSYRGSSAGRCENIALAASKIDGYVVNPGERFSYNTVVGPRTEAAGFKMAHVYAGTKVVDGIGGGICQVSSTLYNAVVLADLKTVTRVNHSIPVNYVPLGRDATVSYGTIDYVFENNKNYPISIKAKTEGTTLTVSVVATSQMDYTVEFVSEFVSSVPYTTKNTEDETLAEGEKKVITPGSNGSVYQSYRVYKKDGKEYDRKPESKSRYQPVAAEVAVGTKKEDKVENPIISDTVIQPEEPKPEIVPEAIGGQSEETEITENAEISQDEQQMTKEDLPDKIYREE